MSRPSQGNAARAHNVTLPAPMLRRAYYHGTATDAAAQAILRAGEVRPGKARRGFMAPVAGRTYVTPELGEALMYANWERDDGKSEPYGYIFEVSPRELGDVQPDEDAVGRLVRTAITDCGITSEHPSQDKLCRNREMARWLAQLATQHLTNRQLDGIANGEYAYYAAGGKRLMPYLPGGFQERMIEYGVPLAVKGAVPVTRAWRYRKDAKVRTPQAFRRHAQEMVSWSMSPRAAAGNPGPRNGACVVLVRAGRVLAISKGTDTSNWNLPGGGLEDGESFEQAAVRELLEETQVDASRARLVPVQHRRSPWGTESVAFVALGDVAIPNGPLVSRPFEGYVDWLSPLDLLRPGCTHAATNLVTFGRLRLV